MNTYVRWLLRIAAVTTPITFLLSWHYDARAAELIARIAELYAEFGMHSDEWDYVAVAEETARLAAESAIFWGRMCHLSVGALGGTSIYMLVRRRRQLALAAGVPGVIATARYRWRRYILMSARHPAQYAGGGLLTTVLLAGAAGFFYALGDAVSGPYGLAFADTIFYAIGASLFLAATLVIMRATRLAARTPGSFGDVLRFITAAGMFGAFLIAWLTLLVFGAAWM